MNRRTSIRQVLRGEALDRVPRALFGAGRWAYRQTGLKIENVGDNPEGFADSLADFFGEFDTDIVFPGSGLNTFPAETIGGELSFKEGQAPLLSRPVIEKTDDARYLSEIDIRLSSHTLALAAVIRRLRERLPDRFLCATSWGPFTWGMILCDWNLLQEKTATDPEFIREVCALGARLSAAYFSLLLEENLVDGVCISDGAATLVRPDVYAEIILPAERNLFEQLSGSGVARFLHQCGAIGPQFPLYAQTGADCISLDANVDIGEAYALYQGRTVTAGNVDAVKIVFGGDDARICEGVRACLAAIPRPVSRFILMPSCDLPPDTPARNARAFLECADLLS